MIKRWLPYLSLFVLLGQNISTAVEWVPDLATARERAAKENKTILLDFTGSDWCGWCMKLKSEVFDQQEFADYAKDHLLMVEVDFPHHKQLSSDQSEINHQLASKFGVTGYPTIILLDSAGKKIGKGGYVPGGPKAFIASIEKHTGSAHPVANNEPEAPPRPPPQFVPIPPTVPNSYGDLALKGISGAKDHRLAMINNQTLMTGESGKVKVNDQRIEITVKEIRDDSVLIVVDGQTRELKLRQY